MRREECAGSVAAGREGPAPVAPEARPAPRSHELGHLILFELDRMLSVRRVVAVLAILLVAVALVSQRLAVLEAQRGALAGMTALDGFYLALNDQTVAALVLPAACLALCADLFSGDAEDGTRLLLLSRVSRRSSYVVAKVVATFVGCLLCVVSLLVVEVASGALLHGLPMTDGSVPAWLAGGDLELLPFSSFGPIPAGWSYPAVLAGLVVVFGLLEGVLVCAVQAAFELAGCRARWVPAVGAAFALALLLGVGSLIQSAGAAFGLPGLTGSFGWVSDRLCLGSYRLGAGFFQTSAGSRAVAADAAATVLHGGDVSYHINSFFELVLFGLFLLVSSFVPPAVLLRRAARPEAERLGPTRSAPARSAPARPAPARASQGRMRARTRPKHQREGSHR